MTNKKINQSKEKNRNRWIIALSLMLSLVLVGCNGSSVAENGYEADESVVQEKDNDSTKEATDAKTDAEALTTEPVKLTFVLDWTPNTNHTGLYVAADKGYFAEAGLEVEIVQPPEDGAEVMVASNQAQFGISFQDTMLHAITGPSPMPIQAVATLIQHNTSGILSRKGEGMERPSGLEGKKYATWDMPIEKAMIKEVVEKDGAHFDKVELVPSTVTDEVSALKSQSVDAIWVFYGWGGIATEVAGLETDYFAFADISSDLDYYTPVVISNQTFLEQQPEVAKKFLAALARGYQFAIDQPEAAADILLAAAPELDATLVYASQNYLTDKYMAEEKVWGKIDGQRWDRFYQWLYEKKLIDEQIPDNFGFSNQFLGE